MVRARKSPFQKYYDEIAKLKEELKKRDEKIEKLAENNEKIETLLSKLPEKTYFRTNKRKPRRTWSGS